MKSSQKYALILNEVEATSNRIKLIERDAGTYEKPIDTDLVKTEKAMFFEKVLAILNESVLNEEE